MILITRFCEECDEEARVVNPMFHNQVRKIEGLTIRGKDILVTTSEQLVHLRMYCRNCNFSSTIQDISLN